jgi:hypothetical protein
VSRSTLYRWTAPDKALKSALDQRRYELQEVTQGRLMKIAGKAIDAVERAIDAGNAKIALAVLDGLGLLPGKHSLFQGRQLVAAGRFHAPDTVAVSQSRIGMA